MDTLYTFWDDITHYKLKVYTLWENITHHKTKSVHFWGLMNSATKRGSGTWPGEPSGLSGFRNLSFDNPSY